MSAQILALAGTFQAAELVRQAANHGTWSGFAATTCLESLFCLESDSVADIYGSKDRLRLGLESLSSVLSGEEDNQDGLQLAVGLLQMQRKFAKDLTMQAVVGERLKSIGNDTAQLEAHEQQEQQAEAVAALYTNTLSTLTPRIVVNGKPQYLQNERTVAWIRTLLFAGLRSAVLWDQLGGGRFRLLFGRRQIVDQAQEILHG